MFINMTFSNINPAHVSLQKITNHKHTEKLKKSWTWKIGNYETLEEYLQSKIENPNTHFYWIMIQGEPAGITGILEHPDHAALQTSTLIAEPYRGSNLNLILKHSTAAAFTNTDIISSVDSNNTASIKSLNKITNTAPSPVWEPKRKRHAHIYLITEITPTETAEQVVKTFKKLQKQLNSALKIFTADVNHAADISLLIKIAGLQNIKTPPEEQQQKWIQWASQTETIQERLHSENVTTLIAVKEGKTVGTGYVKKENNTAYIGAIYIHPEYQKQKIGTQILTQLLTLIPEHYFEAEAQISEENIPSKKLFTKHGFKNEGPSSSKFFTPTIWEKWILKLNS